MPTDQKSGYTKLVTAGFGNEDARTIPGYEREFAAGGIWELGLERQVTVLGSEYRDVDGT